MKSEADFEILIDRYHQGEATKVEIEQLNALLRSDDQALRKFIALMNLDSALAALVTDHHALSVADDDPEPAPLIPARKRPVSGWQILCAVCLVFLVAGAWWSFLPQPIFATVVSCVGVDHLTNETKLRDEWQKISTGTLELITANQARLVIEAPANFRFKSAQSLYLYRGRLAAEIPPSAKRFTVMTPSGNAIDLGTKFGVDVPLQGETEIHVFQGEVVAQSSGGGKQKNLYNGDAFRLQAGSGGSRPLRSGAFIRPSEVASLHAAIIAGQQANSESVLAQLRDDPALIMLLDFESPSNAEGKYQVVQGRWPGSQAPEFVDMEDHIKLDVGGEHDWPQLTLAAWVRIDQLTAPYQSLLHSNGREGDQRGQVHWMVTNQKTVQLGISGNVAQGPDKKQPQADSQFMPGRWMHLALVYDADRKVVGFFVNGQIDEEVQLKVAQPAVLGSAIIGNWKAADRKLSGRIDEMLILGRAMNNAEIKKLFDAGNPYR